MSLFPLIDQPDSGTLDVSEGLPLYRETDWNFQTNQPVWRGGDPVFVTGARAVLVWAWNTLHAERFARDVFSADHGLDLSGLIGHSCTPEVRQSEAVRVVREALLVNPYITGVSQISVSFENAALHLSFRMTTIYGEVTIDGCDIAL